MLFKQFMSALFIGILSLAQLQGQSDPTAVSILKKSENIYKNFKNIDAQFKLTIDIPDQLSEEQTGRLAIMDNMFRVEMTDQDIICDQTTIWTHLKSFNEVQVNYFEEDADMITPTELFSVYKKDYSSYYMGESTKGGHRIHTIDLIPNDKEQSYFKIKLEIDTKTYHFRSFSVFSKDGVSYAYDITSFLTNQNMTAKDFQFSSDKFPGVEIIDLR